MNYSISLTQPYNSIESLEAQNLPNFAVLIGRNGAGKTQILEALDQGRASADHINQREIELHNIASFVPPDAGQTERNNNQLGMVTCTAYLSPPDGATSIEIARSIFEDFAKEIESGSGVQAREDFEFNLRATVQRLPPFAVFGDSAQDSTYEKAIFEQVLNRLRSGNTGGRRTYSSNNPRTFNGSQASLISTAMKLAGKLPHELTRQDIMSASFIEGELLSNPLNEVFTTYRLNEFDWIIKKFQEAGNQSQFDELKEKYRNIYPPPWEKLREIMSELKSVSGENGLFDFEFSNPDNHELNLGNFHNFHFRATMTNQNSNARYNLESLSSGEKILMSLCLISFNQYLDRPSPQLLLLDEIDTLLHPSLLHALITLLDTLFVSQGTKVLMTSHSPMTVAALDESSIFRVTRDGKSVRVSSTTKSEAINELSEGLATIDMGLKIAAHDGAKVTILSEGNNSKHLKRWVELNFPNDVSVFEGLEQFSSDQNLLAYGRLLANMNTNTHFVVVWDWDAETKANTLKYELPQNAKVTPYAFPQRPDNRIAERGIENNYDESLLEPFLTKEDSHGGMLLRRVFKKSDKDKFADHILRCGTRQHFTNYNELFSTISGILEL